MSDDNARLILIDASFVTPDKKQSDVINSEVSAESSLHKLRNGTRVLIPADGSPRRGKKLSALRETLTSKP